MTATSALDADALPHPSSRPLAVRLHPPAERAVRKGHPWVFDSGVRSVDREGSTGDVAVLFDRKNRFLAVGLFDPSGPIRIRILGAGAPAQVGPELFHTRLIAALQRREALVRDPSTTGYRVLHGEADGFGGLVLDRYGDALVLKLYTPAWLPHLRDLLPALEETLTPRVVLGLASRNLASDPHCPQELAAGTRLLGALQANGLPFLESGLRFEAHPLEGHKTGFYLDQRENRRRLGEEVGRLGARRLLNAFSYSGALSLYGARGGVREVVNVDRSGAALAQARRHFAMNPEVTAGVRHQTLEGDAFQVLDGLSSDGRRFGAVVVDPPSFASRAGQRVGALDAYAALTRMALALLEPGGLLVQASCSSRVSAEEFFARVHETARSAGRTLDEVVHTGHPPDHPATFPEAQYLKCLFARAG